jgi:protein-S-isoprenylcysteine O-methyltransferase Ste14
VNTQPNSPHAPHLPPPLIVAVVYAAVWALQRVVPLRFLPGDLHIIPALWLSLGGALIFVTALYALRKAGTSPSPYTTPTALVTTGPYRRSRNPIYLAYAWLYLGLGCWINSWWTFILFPVLIVAMNHFVLAREEAVLEERFGDEYLSYRANTRRWA